MLPQVHVRPLPLLVLLVLSLPLTAQAGPYIYPDTGTTALIPWSQRTDNPMVTFAFDETPEARIQFSYNGWTQGPDPTDPTDMTPRWYSFDVDTGTCGIVTNAEKVNLQPSERQGPDPADPSKVTNQGQQYLSSSNILYVGYWVQRQVKFVHSTPVIETLQPVLAVTGIIENCEGWEPTMRNTCNDMTPVSVTRPITLLGIGYGRTYDGQPQGTPDKNPLLNIVSIGGTDIGSLAAFYPGWRIDANGVQVGLTRDIWDPPSRIPTSNFLLGTETGRTFGGHYKPPPLAGGRNPHFRWSELRGRVEFPCSRRGRGQVPVSLLLDTGIGWSSIRVGEDLAKAVRNNGDEKHLTVNQIADVRPGSYASTFDMPIQRYKYRLNTGPMPGACYGTPDFTQVAYDNRPYFVNTGRNAFNVWRFAFDPWNGRVGFQLRADTCAAAIPGPCQHVPGKR